MEIEIFNIEKRKRLVTGKMISDKQKIKKLVEKEKLIRKETNQIWTKYHNNKLPKDIFKRKQKLLDEKHYRIEKQLSKIGYFK